MCFLLGEERVWSLSGVEVWSFWGVGKLGFFSGVGWVWSFECEFVSYA